MHFGTPKVESVKLLAIINAMNISDLEYMDIAAYKLWAERRNENDLLELLEDSSMRDPVPNSASGDKDTGCPFDRGAYPSEDC